MNRHKRQARRRNMARALATSGRYQDWREISEALQSLSPLSPMPAIFADARFRATIDRICLDARDFRNQVHVMLQVKAALRRLLAGDRKQRVPAERRQSRPISATDRKAWRDAEIEIFAAQRVWSWQKIYAKDRADSRDVEREARQMDLTARDHTPPEDGT